MSAARCAQARWKRLVVERRDGVLAKVAANRLKLVGRYVRALERINLAELVDHGYRMRKA